MLGLSSLSSLMGLMGTMGTADVQVERLFVTSLQRALEEHAPEELEVFSRWFDPSARRIRFHVATVIGAVGYLRRNPSLYSKVIETAGRTASDRAYGDFSQIERKLLETLPKFGRERLVKYLLHSGLRSIHKDAQLSVKRDGEKLLLTVTNSLFCHTPAEDGGQKRCHFYSALFAGLLEKTDIHCYSVTEASCRGQGSDTCSFEVLLERHQAA
jgi:predicted hydrocarbon binding protein